MSDNPRIAELRRRVEKDPTSIAFAQLAEEYRRSGDFLQAVNVCRDGLARHPGYISAQVTLGRALLELGQFKEARTELEAVLSVAPDNLAAIRALADMHQEYGDLPEEFPTALPPTAVDIEPSNVVEPPDIVESANVVEPPHVVPDAGLEQLEQWLAAIVADRARSR